MLVIVHDYALVAQEAAMPTTPRKPQVEQHPQGAVASYAAVVHDIANGILSGSSAPAATRPLSSYTPLERQAMADGLALAEQAMHNAMPAIEKRVDELFTLKLGS